MQGFGCNFPHTATNHMGTFTEEIMQLGTECLPVMVESGHQWATLGALHWLNLGFSNYFC